MAARSIARVEAAARMSLRLPVKTTDSSEASPSISAARAIASL